MTKIKEIDSNIFPSLKTYPLKIIKLIEPGQKSFLNRGESQMIPSST